MEDMAQYRLDKRKTGDPEIDNVTEEDLIRIFGTADENRAVFARFRRDKDFLEQLDVQGKYPGEYVAAYECKVIEHAPTLGELFARMKFTGLPRLEYALRKMPAE